MTTTFPDVSISTDRLVLRPLDAGDVPALTEMMNDELVAAWTTVPAPYTEADARDWIRGALPPNAPRAAASSSPSPSSSPSGWSALVHLAEHRLARPGHRGRLRHAPWARGEGYASESVLAVAQWLFRDQKFERLELRTAADNTAAQQVAQKIGCISEGVLRNAWIARTRTEDGGWADIRTDLIVWSLLPEDLEGIPEQLADADGYAPYPEWLHSPR